ncbi:Sec-independent protein translocase protein TatB [Paenalcaligenes sp. Me131]|uniref:Sec-independent protein translocase protein TatB n=1 Tax=Paenalcaligenes sp. Me131 TaxID=3392636 RepID=UPI003D2B4EC2
MFDISFSELLLIAVVALIVLGPERLPKVARTVGHLMGRAQRYMNDVKSDIQREMDLEEINKLKNQMQDAANSVRSSVNDSVNTIKDPLSEAQQALADLHKPLDTPTEPAAATEQKAALPETAEAAKPAAAATPDNASKAKE